MRLIDADALIALIKRRIKNSMIIGWLCSIIRDAPTIDAVPVVRCEDCIRRYDTDECPMCFLIKGKYYEYTNGNGFCDRGERKEGVTNG